MGACRYLVVIATSMTCLALAGCASMQSTVPPEIALVNLRFGEVTFLESTLTLDIRFTNENPEPLVVDGGVFQFYLDGDAMGKGSSGERFEIPRLDSVVHQFELHISHLNAIPRVRKIVESKAFEYALRGKLYIVSASGGTRTMKVAQQGNLDLQRDFPRRAPSSKNSQGPES